MCTRVVYQGTNATILTGRSMDWKEECRSNLWIFPRGMDRSGEAGNNPVLWKSKYGSVIASAYDICSTDGMNERGLSPTCFGWPNPPIRNGAAPNRD